jgi:hypothetical protein
MVEGYRRLDPPTTPQLAVPVAVPNACFTSSTASTDPLIKASGCLILIAFYFLLRVGEYTKPRTIVRNGATVSATRTVQFMVGNVGFFKDGKIISRSSSLHILLSCDAAMLKINNQKNGRMGDTIHQQAINKACCPIKALAMQVHDILSSGGTDNTLLCEVLVNDAFVAIESKMIIDLVRNAAKELSLSDVAIDPDLLGSHSLRAGGAMALKLHGYDDTTIMKMGRWTSLTFLQYIHNQIAHLSDDISKKMSEPLPFLNIAAIEGTL